MRNSCADCHFFYYDKAPFSETYVGCDKHHWSTPEYETDFRYAMRKALECEDFKHVTPKDLEPGLTNSDIGQPTHVNPDWLKAFSKKRGAKNGGKNKGG